MLFSSRFLVCTVLISASVASPTKTVTKHQVLLPKPTGLYQVGRTTTELIDYSRNQPFLDDAEPIKLMISVYYPVIHQHHSVPAAYMLPETALIEDITLSSVGLSAPNGTFEKVYLQLASPIPTQNLTNQSSCSFPLVVFMPGEGSTRLFYGQLAATIASNGYTVVAIDPAYDVDVVQYPDNTFAFINPSLWNESSPDIAAVKAVALLGIQTRVDDVSFVLDSLANHTLAHDLIPNLPPTGLNTTHVGMFGHSLGGSTSYSILDQDDRILGGLDMDGDLFGPTLDNGSSKPFMFIGVEGHTRENPNFDPNTTWVDGWNNLTGWKRDITVKGALHYDFSDYPVLFETLGITPCNETIKQGLLVGDLEGKRALEIVTSYVSAFLDMLIYGKCSALLEGPVDKFPEVSFEY